VGLAILQSTGLIATAKNAPSYLISGCNGKISLLERDIKAWSSWWAVMVAGTSIYHWLGELITDRGIGNGSRCDLTSIASASVLAVAIKETRTLAALGGLPRRDRDGHDHGAARVSSSSRPAAHPGAVRQEAGRSADVRRLLDLHPDQGEPSVVIRSSSPPRCCSCRCWSPQFADPQGTHHWSVWVRNELGLTNTATHVLR